MLERFVKSPEKDSRKGQIRAAVARIKRDLEDQGYENLTIDHVKPDNVVVGEPPREAFWLVQKRYKLFKTPLGGISTEVYRHTVDAAIKDEGLAPLFEKELESLTRSVEGIDEFNLQKPE